RELGRLVSQGTASLPGTTQWMRSGARVSERLVPRRSMRMPAMREPAMRALTSSAGLPAGELVDESLEQQIHAGRGADREPCHGAIGVDHHEGRDALDQVALAVLVVVGDPDRVGELDVLHELLDMRDILVTGDVGCLDALLRGVVESPATVFVAHAQD